MSTLRLSIALCTYNGAAYLNDQLASLLNQSRQPDELIVSDDGSTDDTLQMLERFRRTAPFPVTIHQTEHNLGSNLNFGEAIARTSGDIIFLCDQDDVWLPHKLAAIANVFAKNAAIGLVYSDGWIVDASLQKTGQTMWQTLNHTPSHRTDHLAHLLKRNHITGAMMAFRAELKPVVLPTSEFWVHDYWIAMLAAMMTEIRALPEPLILYRQHSANQIGLTHQVSLLHRIKRALYIPNQRYEDAFQRMDALLERIDARQLCPSAEQRQHLLEKRDHWQQRATLPNHLVERSQIIVSEVVRGRYQKYSNNGYASAVRDWLAYFVHDKA